MSRGDEEGLELIQEGDTAALVAFMRRHNQRLFRTARAILRDDAEAEDVVQETYLRALANLATFRGDAAVATWLTKIAMHESFARARRRRRAQGLQLEVEALPTPERRAYDDEVRHALEEAIDGLPEGLRLVFVLRILEGLSSLATADLLGISVTAVKVRLFRARVALRRFMRARADLDGLDLFEFAGERCDRIIAAVLVRLVA